MKGAGRVRPAAITDWPIARELLREGDDLHAALASDYFRPGERSLGEWLGWLEDATLAMFIVEAPPGNEPAGLLVVRIYDTPKDPTMVARRRGHVEIVVVARRHRRRGLGRQLMEAAAAWARQQGAVELLLTTWAGNSAADAFYERLGYRPLSRVLSQPLG